MLNILHAYKYFCYRTYVDQLRHFSDPVPKLTTLLSTTLLLHLNLLTICLGFLIGIGNRQWFKPAYVFPAAFAMLGLNCVFLFYFDALIAAVDRFSTETELQRKQRRIWCWIYEIGTFGLFFATVVLFRK